MNPSFCYTLQPEDTVLTRAAHRSVSTSNFKKPAPPASAFATYNSKHFEKSTNTHGPVPSDDISYSVPNFNSYSSPNLELHSLHQLEKEGDKPSTDRKKKILQVWELFQVIYIDILNRSHMN